jgi:hypothetical protein
VEQIIDLVLNEKAVGAMRRGGSDGDDDDDDDDDVDEEEEDDEGLDYEEEEDGGEAKGLVSRARRNIENARAGLAASLSEVRPGRVLGGIGTRRSHRNLRTLTGVSPPSARTGISIVLVAPPADDSSLSPLIRSEPEGGRRGGGGPGGHCSDRAPPLAQPVGASAVVAAGGRDAGYPDAGDRGTGGVGDGYRAASVLPGEEDMIVIIIP